MKMQRYDIAIRGSGMLPGLLAVHLLQRDSGQSLLLLSNDAEIAGTWLEPVIASSLSPAAREVVDPYVVNSWPGYLVTGNGRTREVPEQVLLLDPVQLWLDLQNLIAPEALITGVDRISYKSGRLCWEDNGAMVDHLVDLDRITRHDEAGEIIGLEAARSLPLPVLVDLDTGAEPWDAFQHIPLGDERIYVRKRKCLGDPETELTRSLGRLLSDMMAF